MTIYEFNNFLQNREIECKCQDFYVGGKKIKKINLRIPTYLIRRDVLPMLGTFTIDNDGYLNTTLCFDAFDYENIINKED